MVKLNLVNNRALQSAVALDEVAVKICKPQEKFQLHSGCWGQSHFFRMLLDISFSDEVCQKGENRMVKLALLSFPKLVLQEALKDLSDMENVFLGRPAEDEDVVEVDKHKTIQNVTEHIIDQCLENNRSVGEPKRHDQILMVCTGSVESPLPLLAYPNKMVGIPKVQHRKDGSPLEKFKSRGDEW
jgi:hypothetical protein